MESYNEYSYLMPLCGYYKGPALCTMYFMDEWLACQKWENICMLLFCLCSPCFPVYAP